MSPEQLDPSVSFVVEWDNVRLVDADHIIAMLREVPRQVRELETSAEFIVLYDPADVDKAELEKIVDRAGLLGSEEFPLRIEGHEGAKYYELKNIGADLAVADIVVFVDSDVVPEAGWLRAILEPFSDPGVEVVGGATYLGPLDSTRAKAFALFWFFPLRSDDDSAVEPGSFYANNVAVRRSTLAVHRWPAGPGVRTQNTFFASSLRKANVRVVKARKARVMHAPPDIFIRRALAEGYDVAARNYGTRSRWWAPVAAVASGVLLWRRIAFAVRVLDGSSRRAVGLTPGRVPLAFAIGLAYAAVAWAGYMVATVAPRFAARRFAI